MRWLLVLVMIFAQSRSVQASSTDTDQRDVVEFMDHCSGLFSNLMKVAEFIYCIKSDENLRLYINMYGAYGYEGNTFKALFKPVGDPQVITQRPFPGARQFTTCLFPSEFYSGFKAYPADDFTCLRGFKYIHKYSPFYTHPDFQTYRNRLHPIVKRYLQPEPVLQGKIDSLVQKINQPIEVAYEGSNQQKYDIGSFVCSLGNCVKSYFQPESVPQGKVADMEQKINRPVEKVADGGSNQMKYKIGFFVRTVRHYVNCNMTPAQFLDNVERDVDAIMESRDPRTTQIFLATLLQPVVDRLSAKYNVVVLDCPRVLDVVSDWNICASPFQLSTAQNAIIDTWALSHCDEVWGGSSEMLLFAGCLNPSMKISLLPALAEFDGL